jgi:hypothetical protein
MLHGFSFLTAFCIAQVLSNHLLLHKIGEPYYHNKHFTTQYHQYLSAADSFNTVFIGSSRIYRQVNPQIIDQQLEAYDIKSYNLGAPATFMPETFYLLDRFLEKQSKENPVSYIFMELTGITPIKLVNWFAPQSYYYLDISKLKLALNTWFGNPDLSWTKASINAYPFIQGYVVKQILPQSVLGPRLVPEQYTGIHKDGYYPLEHEVGQFHPKGLISRREKFLADTSVLAQRVATQRKWKPENLDETLADDLNQLIDKAAEKNIRLYFIIVPKMRNYSSLAELKDAIVDDRLIDMGNPDEFPQFNLVENNFDHGHFNQKGAALFSDLLAGKIKGQFQKVSERPQNVLLQK